MNKLLFATAAAATMAIAAPASAAVFTFNLNSGGTNSSSTYGNARTWTLQSGGETLQVRVTGWSQASNGIITSSFVGQYADGLGVTGRTDSGSDYHAVDSYGSTDFLVFQFSKIVEAGNATTTVWRQSNSTADSDMTAMFLNTSQAWTTSFTASQLASGSGMTVLGTSLIPGGASTSTRDVNPLDYDSNMLILAAGMAGNSNADGFKLKSLVVTTQVAAVPEPATWAMMIAGFGMVGAGMRTRRTATRQTASA